MKSKTVFICQNCGSQSPRWIGKCPQCENWNSYVEEMTAPSSSGAGRPVFAAPEAPVLLKDIQLEEKNRFLTQIREFDRVLGGGLVPGSVTLIGGDPGIGKSTLSLQVACALSARGLKVFYVSGEESVPQAKLRAERISKQEHLQIYIANQTDLNLIIEQIQTLKPDVVFVDSIQVVYLPEITSSPGSVSQVRECAGVLTTLAKSLGLSLFLIGHVTKEGMLAGPRVLEHIVDTVLYFEGERYSSYRILRATKNRFGSTNELGVFEMTSGGLMEVLNPSEIFLSERPQDAPGSVVVPILEGTRPFLVEIQGLVSHASFGMVRQKAQGFDANRLALLVAVLEKKLRLNLQDKDVFLNVVGGVRIMDPAADLGVVLSIASALRDEAVSSDTVVLGEVGLSAEVRSASSVVLRIKEAEKLGFKRCLLPKNNLKTREMLSDVKMELIPVENVKEALSVFSQPRQPQKTSDSVMASSKKKLMNATGAAQEVDS